MHDYDLPSLFQLARALLHAPGIIPRHLKTEGEIVAVILAGRELGIPPMASLRTLKVIHGQVVLDAAMQLGLMQSRGIRARWLKDGTDGQEAALEVSRNGSAPYISRYTIEMAQRAGLAGSDNWKKHTAAMLRARCVTAAGKAYAGDVLAGVHAPGEMTEDAATEEVPLHVLEVPNAPQLPAEPAPQLPASTGYQTPAEALAADLDKEQDGAKFEALLSAARTLFRSLTVEEKRSVTLAVERNTKRMEALRAAREAEEADRALGLAQPAQAEAVAS